MHGNLAPPAEIRVLRDVMYGQYVKIIADSAGVGKKQWAFAMDRFKKLESGDIRGTPSGST